VIAKVEVKALEVEQAEVASQRPVVAAALAVAAEEHREVEVAASCPVDRRGLRRSADPADHHRAVYTPE
jgi:hypothetical protein